MPELVKENNLIEDSTTSKTLNRMDKESDREVTTTTVTRTETSKTEKTGSAIIVMPLGICKQTAVNQRQTELPY
jgi:hypothetical protein